jgi:hypothetical protein
VTEEVALSLRTVLALKEAELFSRFDALGNHALLEVPAHADGGDDNRSVIWIGGHLADKRLVNLQNIDGKLSEIAEAGIAGAEVIQRSSIVLLPPYCLRSIAARRPSN